MIGKFEDLRNRLHFLDRQAHRHLFGGLLFFFLALLLFPATSQVQTRRFGIFLPKFDVYTRTQDVIDRVHEYLFKLKPSEIPLAEYPVISEADLLSYDWETHTMHLREPFRIRVPAPTVGEGVPFVVVADGVPLYVGKFWSTLSSTFPGGPTIDIGLLDFEESKDPVIRLRFAPVGADGKALDPRGDPRLLKVFQELGKLKVK